MSKQHIKIGNTDYYLSSDRLNWIVSRRVECSISKSFPYGYKFVDETYHHELVGAFKRVFDETVRMAKVKTLPELLRVCEQTYEMLKRALKYDFKDEKSAA